MPFIGHIVDEAHKSVESSEGVAFGFREEEKSIVEIAVSGPRDVMTVIVGIAERSVEPW